DRPGRLDAVDVARLVDRWRRHNVLAPPGLDVDARADLLPPSVRSRRRREVDVHAPASRADARRRRQGAVAELEPCERGVTVAARVDVDDEETIATDRDIRVGPPVPPAMDVVEIERRIVEAVASARVLAWRAVAERSLFA